MNHDEFKALITSMGPGTRLTRDNSPRAHRVVARSAKEFCAELYATYATKWPGFRDAFPSENDFVRTYWAHFIAPARATLARMLATNIAEDLKATIHDGLIRDQSLAATRRHVPQIKMDL